MGYKWAIKMAIMFFLIVLKTYLGIPPPTLNYKKIQMAMLQFRVYVKKGNQKHILLLC